MRAPNLLAIAVVIMGLVLAASAGFAFWPSLLRPVLIALGLEHAPPRVYTVQERLDEIGPAASARLKAYFAAAGVAYPPAAITLVGLKSERTLQLYARGSGADSSWKIIHIYQVKAASGHLGPKLREGDKQVPEGVYGIDTLNPKSHYNVSMRVSYPNAFDKARAAEEHRDNLGGDIMIHGRAASIGCLAMGDPASEDLFTLAASVGIGNVAVIIAPLDLRTQPRPAVDGAPAWLPTLYSQIEQALKPFPAPSGSAS